MKSDFIQLKQLRSFQEKTQTWLKCMRIQTFSTRLCINTCSTHPIYWKWCTVVTSQTWLFHWWQANLSSLWYAWTQLSTLKLKPSLIWPQNTSPLTCMRNKVFGKLNHGSMDNTWSLCSVIHKMGCIGWQFCKLIPNLWDLKVCNNWIVSYSDKWKTAK